MDINVVEQLAREMFAPEMKPRPAPRPVHVYFLAAEDVGMVKIGSSYDVPKRIAGLMAASPVTLRLLKVVPGGLKVEKRLHRELKAHRVHHEWFRASEDVMRAIKRA